MPIKASLAGAVIPPATPFCIYYSQELTMNSTFVLNMGAYGSGVFSNAQQLSDLLQTAIQMSGCSYFGTPFGIWIALPQGETPPTDWDYIDITDPGTRIPIEFSEGGCLETTACYQFAFAVDDPNAWFSYYFSSTLGSSEFPQFLPYSDVNYEALLIAAVKIAYGAQATATFTLVGSDIVITISNVPIESVSLTSTPDFGAMQVNNGIGIDC